MDYAYFNPTQAQHYPYLGMQSPPGYPSTGMDPDTLRSIEPLDAGAGMLPQNGSYDAFSFAHGLAISHGSPLPHTPNPVGSVDSGLGGDMDDSRTIPTTRSSSEEKDTGLTPAQSRRKAQNRAAQRAFRERKERHVRDLEAKLSLLESSAHSLQSDNERLKLALQRARTENEILRATSAQSPSNSRPVSGNYTSPGAPYSDDEDEEPYNVQSLSEGAILTNGEQHNLVTKKSIKTKDIPASQLWDVIQSHHLVKQGIVDVADVCERLKGVAKCSGTGPVYDERLIWAAIESSRRSGGDELI